MPDEALTRYLAQLQEQAVTAQCELDYVTQLQQHVPGLTTTVDRWQQRRLGSAWANARADRAEIKHNCGCCHDSPLEVRPYVVLDLKWTPPTIVPQSAPETNPAYRRLYCHPERFVIGEKCGSYDRFDSNWETRLRDVGIAEAAIQQVHVYQEAQRALRRAELEAELEHLDDPPPEFPEPVV